MRLNSSLLRLIFLISLVLVIAFVHVHLHRKALLSIASKPVELEPHNLKSVNVWRQPDEAFRFFPVQIGEQDYRFHFTDFASILTRVSLDSNQLLVINDQTKNQLKRLTENLPPDLRVIDRARLDFLIQKSITGKAGVQLTQLFHAYVRYSELLHVHLQQVKSAQSRGEYEVLQTSMKRIKQLQATVFGKETASVFFKRDNISMHYLIQRRILTLDNSMSAVDKQNMGLQLQQAYLLDLAQLKVLEESEDG
ncbi:lipase secretion chaperone [uncultured Shewanella sp.]|uniref:lipase secretion chaperone n=1 Tax=uncultured Shewanella sp. TaxID=173975 RepID=UPI00262AE138|nr:lipase secretion chaperone [uncultured Shewanella sp.]